MKSLYSIVSIAIMCLPALQAADAPKFTSNGKLEFPTDYREWIFLSSGLGMTYSSGRSEANPQFDNVFVEPSAYREFLKTGKWPEKTMFVLDVRASATEGSINRGGHFQQGQARVSAEVKDSKRFGADQWAYFAFPENKQPAERLPRSAGCFACHSANGAVENTFVQFYPTLIDVARSKGTLKLGALK
jgi:hypothetical protein